MDYTSDLDTATVTGRENLYHALIGAFMSEAPGTLTEKNHYIYTVETLSDGSHILLRRPTWLNKGMDFTVNSDRYSFLAEKNHISNPSHANIVEMLAAKRAENPTVYESRVRPLITRIFNVEPIPENEFAFPEFTTGEYPNYSVELILKLLKWLFAEQDVTYWNASGRYKLFEHLREQNLA